MSADAPTQNRVNPAPFLAIYLFYSLLFGVVLYDLGLSPMLWAGMTVLLFGMGFLGFSKIAEKDLPLIIFVLYVVGAGIGLFFYVEQIGSDPITAMILTVLFLMGIAGNVLYFLSEKQKLDYLNGQISESGLTMRRFENWFPLWLVLIGNLFLVFLVTPLLWGASFKVFGAKLFTISTDLPHTWFNYEAFGGKLLEEANWPTLYTWFGYVLENVNQSLLGVASLLGIKFAKNAVVPTGLGKVLVAVFRIGILSLGLGALKRYLDLKKTTRLLMLAMGRAGWEQEKWESEVEGSRSPADTGEAFESRRQMWQLRIRLLLQLFPAQQPWVVNEVLGKGDLQLKLQGRLKRQDLKIPEGYEPAFQPKHLSDWIRLELADALADPTLYVNTPGVRYDVLRDLCRMLSSKDAGEVPARVRRKVTLTLMRLRRSNDPQEMKNRVERCLYALIDLAKEQAQSTDDAWVRFNEERAGFAAVFGLIRLGKVEHLVDLLPALRREGSALQVDAIKQIEELIELEDVAEAGVLKAVERLLVGRDDELAGPLLEELKLSLEQLSEEKARAYRAFAARALGYFMITEEDEEHLRHGARVLLACGRHFAIKAVWRLVRLRNEPHLRRLLLDVLIEGGLAELAGQFLRLKLVAGDASTELLAATLLGELPATPTSRRALREATVDAENAEDVRWRSLCSLGRLAHPGDRGFLEQTRFGLSRPRLWAANQYALYRCGSVAALESLIEQIGTLADDDPRYEASAEVLADAHFAEASAICTALDADASNDHRLESCETLVGLRVPSALVVLSRLLYAPKTPKKIRQTAAEDLGILGRSLRLDDMGLLAEEQLPTVWASDPLLYALENDDDRLVRIRSARALGRLGLPEIQERFKQSLLDPDENALVRQVVAQAVGEMGDDTWLDFLEQQYPIEKSAQVRQGMISAFDRLGAKADFFVSCLDDSNAKIRQLSLDALARRELREGDKQKLLPMLSDKHRDVRTSAAKTLGVQDVEQAIPALCESTNHENEGEKNVRRASIKALQKLVHTDAQKEEVWPYLERVWNEDPDHLVIRDCAAAMARLYGAEAASVLLQALTADEKRKTWTKSYAGIVWALGETHAPEARSVLFGELEKQLRSEEYNFARLIALIRPGGLAGGSEALPLLLELVENNEEAYSWVASQVIAEIGDFAAIGPMTDILERKRNDGSIEPNTEAAILVSLVRLGVWERLEELIALLHDTSPAREVARRRALGMLPDIDMGLSPMLLMQVMNPRATPHEKLRETAVKSLGRLAGQLEQSLQVLQWQAQADPRAKIREAAQEAIDAVGGRIEKAARSLRRGRSFDTRPKVSYHGEPLHPAWGLPQATIDEEITARRAVSTPTVAKAAPEAPKVRPPTALELLMEGVLASDRARFEAQWKKAQSDEEKETPFAELWGRISARLEQLDGFQSKHGDGWVFVPGNPNGSAEFWPFLLREALVTRREYAAFCEETGHPVPSGWRSERQSAQVTSPVTQINWHDAEAFAAWKGHRLPSHQQLLMAQTYPLASLDGAAATWTPDGEHREWTRSPHPRRRQLIRTFSPSSNELQHAQRSNRDIQLSFRTSLPLNGRDEPLLPLLLQGAHKDLLRLFAYCAHELGIELPFQRDQWLPALKQQAGEVDDRDASTGSSVLDQQRQRAAERAAEEKRRREEAERKRREEEERKRRLEEERIARQKQAFWQALGQGQLDEALGIWQADKKKLGPEIAAAEGPLRELQAWLQSHGSMIWLSGDLSEGRRHSQRAVLLESFVSRQAYSEFCKSNDLPLPRGMKSTAAEISAPEDPITGISLYDAKHYASYKGASLPTLEQLQKVRASASGYHSHYEWTLTTRQRRRGLYQVFQDNGWSDNSTRSHQRSDQPFDVSFRLCYDLKPQELPSLLQELLEHVPEAVHVQQLPSRLGQALREKLNPRAA